MYATRCYHGYGFGDVVHLASKTNAYVDSFVYKTDQDVS